MILIIDSVQMQNNSISIDQIRNAGIDEILQYVKQIDALKVALESVNEFRNQSVKYAILEAEALLRVIELGGEKKLGLIHRKTARWLSALSKDEQSSYISMCRDGLTIDNIYKREIEAPQKRKEKLKEIKEYEDFVIEQLKDCGVADLSRFAEYVRGELTYSEQDIRLANDLIDGARHRLRKNGAVGVGEDTGIYVLPEVGSTDQIRQAIRTRFKSICNDIASIYTLSLTSGTRMYLRDLYDEMSFPMINAELGDCDWAEKQKRRDAKKRAVHYLFLMFNNMGLFADFDWYPEFVKEIGWWADVIEIKEGV